MGCLTRPTRRAVVGHIHWDDHRNAPVLPSRRTVHRLCQLLLDLILADVQPGSERWHVRHHRLGGGGRAPRPRRGDGAGRARLRLASRRGDGPQRQRDRVDGQGHRCWFICRFSPRGPGGHRQHPLLLSHCRLVKGSVEERRDRRRHGDGQGHRPRLLWIRLLRIHDSRRRHPLLRGRRPQRQEYLEERRDRRWHGASHERNRPTVAAQGPHSGRRHHLLRSRRRHPRGGVVEDRWNHQWHGDGQGCLQWQQRRRVCRRHLPRSRFPSGRGHHLLCRGG